MAVNHKRTDTDRSPVISNISAKVGSDSISISQAVIRNNEHTMSQ